MVYNLSEANQGRGKILNFVEVNGKISGRLATMSALASGAQKCYIPQMKFTLPEIVKDVKEFLDKFEGSISGLIIWYFSFYLNLKVEKIKFVLELLNCTHL